MLLVPPAQLQVTTIDSSDVVMSAEERAFSLLYSTYDEMATVDCLDITPEGTMAWKTVVKRYAIFLNQVHTYSWP